MVCIALELALSTSCRAPSTIREDQAMRAGGTAAQREVGRGGAR